LNGILGLTPPKIADGSRYYFSRLTNEQKRVYKAVLFGIKNRLREIKMPLRPINEISKIFNYVLLDNPMLFYVSSSFQQSSDLFKKKCAVIPNYSYSRWQSTKYSREIVNCLRVFDAIKTKSDIEKELYIHDFCLSNFKYDYAFGEHSGSVLGPVLNRVAVCEGIAKFVKLALDYVGVSSLVVLGRANNPALDAGMEGHAWNIVRVDGETYHLDVTFDMTLQDKMLRHDYFNLCDREIKKDHAFVDDVPPCVTAGKDYYSANSLFINRLSELDNYVGRALKQGKRRILVKIKNERYTNDVADKVMTIAQRQFSAYGTGSSMIETSYNSSQMVFEINFK